MMFAAQYGHRPIVELLVRKGADLFQKAQVSHTLGSGVYNLYSPPFTHNINHVRRVHSLPFTMLPTVVPLSVPGTCCPSSETGSLRLMTMV